MQGNTKRRLIVTGIVAAVLLGAVLLGYICVNMAFSLIGDSFYQSEVTAEDFQRASAGGEKDDPAKTVGDSGEPDESDESHGADKQPDGKDTGSRERSISFDRLHLSAEEFKTLQKKVPFSDKMAVLSILSKGLSAADYTELIGMLSGGISSSEVKRAYQIVSRGLSSEDKEKIWGYYDTYKHLIQ